MSLKFDDDEIAIIGAGISVCIIFYLAHTAVLAVILDPFPLLTWVQKNEGGVTCSRFKSNGPEVSSL